MVTQKLLIYNFWLIDKLAFANSQPSRLLEIWAYYLSYRVVEPRFPEDLLAESLYHFQLKNNTKGV